MTQDTFDFGSNWQTFVDQHFNPGRLEQAERSLVSFCGENALRGKRFLDIGCGSGLFSLAALRLGAAEIVSFDLNEKSVQCTRQVRDEAGAPENWTVHTGSALDDGFLETLGTFDLVYAWGCLHHTGQMWKAVEKAAGRVGADGLFYLSIYNRADGLAFYPDGRFGSSRFWLWEKKMYNRLPGWMQNIIVEAAALGVSLIYLLTLRNPREEARKHQERFRGMSWKVDIRDWLGGYPYECARADEVFSFLREKDFELLNLKCNNGLLCNEYLFRRKPGDPA